MNACMYHDISERSGTNGTAHGGQPSAGSGESGLPAARGAQPRGAACVRMRPKDSERPAAAAGTRGHGVPSMLGREYLWLRQRQKRNPNSRAAGNEGRTSADPAAASGTFLEKRRSSEGWRRSFPRQYQGCDRRFNCYLIFASFEFLIT